MMIAPPHRDARFEEWLAKINSACGRFCAATLGERFSGDVQERRTHTLRLSIVDITQTRLYRTSREVAQSDDGHFFTVFQLSGQALMEQAGHGALLQPGDMTLIDASRPSNFVFSDRSRQISLLLPRSRLEQGGSPNCARRFPAEMGVVRFAQRLMADSLENPALNRAESEAVLDAVASLLKPVLAARDDENEVNERAFRRVITLIDKHIQSEELSPVWIAGEAGVSVRSLYRLFARRGLVVAQYIRNRRLDLCAQALRGASVRQKMADIGFAWGFVDHSHFSTAFKARFGVSPSAYRKMHC